MTTALNAAGGLGIFLLAMAMMTDGLKAFGGDNLTRIFRHWTSSPIRAAAAGGLITALVQSSGAVTVATIGFVNAGILGLTQSLGVVFGANVGTTMTAWLVAAVGFDFKIEALALPMIALGVALRLGTRRKRLRGLGGAIAGFGLFFLGLAILKESFGDLSQVFGTATLRDAGVSGVALFALIGLAATVLAQSSSAAIALILTAASTATLGIGAAAAAIIGANVGSTSTAALAVIGATPNARRVAAGHIVFNLITGLIALMILPAMLWFVRQLGHTLGLADKPVVLLALFHTVFNILGVALLLPFVDRMARVLEKWFKTPEEDIGRPQFIDSTVAATPDFAVLAMRRELARMQALVCEAALAALDRPTGRVGAIERRALAIGQLGEAVRSFAVTVHMEDLSRVQAELLPQHLRIARYLAEAAHLLSDLDDLRQRAAQVDGPMVPALDTLRESIRQTMTVCAAGATSAAGATAAGNHFEKIYHETKAALLQAAASHALTIGTVDNLLDATSASRRLVEQVVKATAMLRSEDAEIARDGGEGATPVAAAAAETVAGETGEAAEAPPEDASAETKPEETV